MSNWEKLKKWINSGRDEKYFEDWMLDPFINQELTDENWDWDEYFDGVDNVIFDDDCQFYFVFDGKISNLVLFNPPDYYYYYYDADEDE